MINASITSGQSRPKMGQLDLISQSLHYHFSNILDIGAGTGWVSDIFLQHGKKVAATFLIANSPSKGVHNLGAVPIDDMSVIKSGSFDAIWASHVLEHTPNPGKALSECHRILQENGYLFLSVPPFKHNVVGGHLSTGWNIGIMVYLLSIFGFDVREGSFIKHGYNIAAFVRKSIRPDISLEFSQNDMPLLKKYLPDWIHQNVYGNVKSYNWEWKCKPTLRDSYLVSVKTCLRDMIHNITRGRQRITHP